MGASIERTLDFVEFLFDTGYLGIAEEPEQEKLTEAFILFCIDNGCCDVGYENAERKAFEIYERNYRRGENDNSANDDEFEKEAEEKALTICLRKLNTYKP